MFTLDKLLQQAEEIVQKKKRKHRRKYSSLDFDNW